MSNFSAASFWDIPCLETVLVSEIDKTSKVSFTVSKQSERFLKKDKIIHLCEVALPTNAVVSKNGTMVASPELVFLQLACKLDIHRLILLGLQLCSHPPGNPSEAITTKHKLKSFLAKTPGHHGHRKALRAVKYIEDGSASVMESIAYMILTLPHALGGYGLDGTVFNHEIKLNNEAAKRLGQKRCFADLYYKQAKLAVEYESFAFHNSPMEQGKDAMRSAILERQNVEVMHLSTIQLYNKDACMDFAFNLASRIGKRMQIRAKEFDQMHGLLRTLLPVGKPVVESDNGEY
ncbi:MAG: hypothetical protein PHE31_04590 [Tissierellia bacterium]|nr:hypothetical protein [Tissierellia bacterium]